VVAERIGGELDVLVAHKLGAPGNPEYAIGAVAEDGTAIVDEKLVERLGIPPEYVEDEQRRQRLEVERRAKTLRGGGGPTALSGRVCVVVDDGVATGATLEASLRLVIRADPKQVVVAIPVGPPDTIRRLASIVDVVVCPLQPAAFFAVGAWFDDFGQVSERTVVELLERR
jgi:predicted phosphoribosyltransferase